ncbi:MAG: hypothetical protein GWP08_06575 [Nitrospiraceae bacterium]|nr:hypothetical protein [Nitrospiraceae bacterium]
MASVYLEAYALTHETFLKETAVRTLDYVLRDIQDEGGARYRGAVTVRSLFAASGLTP